MARYEASPFGRIRGKVGEAVGEYWKGVKYMKSYTVPTDRKSQKQLNVRWLWFVLGSLYGLYHSRLKENARSGLQALPLLELDYQDYLRESLRQAQNSIEHLQNVTFNYNSADFTRSYISGDDFTEIQGNTPIFNINFDDGLDSSDWTIQTNQVKGTLILFDVANKKTWCYAMNDGLTVEDVADLGTYANIYGSPYTAETNNITFAFLLLDVTAKTISNGQTVRRWSFAFKRYNEITFE